MWFLLQTQRIYKEKAIGCAKVNVTNDSWWNKRDMKLTQHHKELTKSSQETLPFNLEKTIKRMAERTKVKI